MKNAILLGVCLVAASVASWNFWGRPVTAQDNGQPQNVRRWNYDTQNPEAGVGMYRMAGMYAENMAEPYRALTMAVLQMNDPSVPAKDRADSLTKLLAQLKSQPGRNVCMHTLALAYLEMGERKKATEVLSQMALENDKLMAGD
jgi:hypothetical protein